MSKDKKQEKEDNIIRDVLRTIAKAELRGLQGNIGTLEEELELNREAVVKLKAYVDGLNDDTENRMTSLEYKITVLQSVAVVLSVLLFVAILLIFLL